MKVSNRLMVAAVALASASISTQASAADWYVSASLLSSELDSVNTQSTSPVAGVTRSIDLEADDESGLQLSIGRTLLEQDNGNTLSLELSYADVDFDAENIAFMGRDFIAANGGSEGNFEFEALTLSAVYQFNFGDFKPFVGVGIGQADFAVDGRYGGSVGQGNQARPPFITGDDKATAVSFKLGLEYSLSENWGLFAQYDVIDVDEVQFSRTGGGPGGLPQQLKKATFRWIHLASVRGFASKVGFK